MLDDFSPNKRPEPDYTPRGADNTSSEIKPETSDQLKPADAPPENPSPEGPVAPKKTEKTKNPMSKKKKIIRIAAIVVLLGGGGFAGWWFGLRDTGTPDSSNTFLPAKIDNQTEEDEDLVALSLSGIEVEKDSPLTKRPVTSIMIENSGEARPQSGLREADVVFEAIAEGGITRFLALFQSKAPEYIGPVRSARPYYVEWAKAFDAGYAHAGGSPDGLARIGQLGVKDINGFAFGADSFFRTSDRFAPHNYYTKFSGLDKINADRGYTSSNFTPWQRKDDVAQSPTANKIDINISSSFYNVHYNYDAATNTYLRSLGGEPHKDEKSGAVISPDVVLVMVMNRSQSGIYSFYETTGTGSFIAFQDGVASTGTWSRADYNSNYTFKDKYGFDFNFNRGQVWVSVVTALGDVAYTP